MTSQAKDRRLGRGLAALLGTPLDDEGNPLPETDTAPTSSATPAASSGPSVGKPVRTSASPATEAPSNLSARQVLDLNVYEIDNNPFQPRRQFNESEIASLAESLKEHEQLQPVLVRRVGDRYQLISGERRLRAAIHAGMKTVRAEVREADDRLVAELAIIENLQRKDLNAIEKALSFRRYIDEHKCTQDELGRRLKIDRSTIANFMRLLELPEKILSWIQDEVISAGHGRALLSLGKESQQIEVAKMVIEHGWSVRNVEMHVAEIVKSEDEAEAGIIGVATKPKKRSVTPHIDSLQQELKHQLGTKVEIRQTAMGKGKITIHFANPDEFERLRALLSTQAPVEMRRAA